jgi:predicted oxidoreductase
MADIPARSFVSLGKSGRFVSPIAWGMWRFRGTDVAAARRRVEAALEAGFSLFDTADVYGPDNGEPFGAAEALLGRVFAEAPELREGVLLASKGGIRPGTPYDSSAAWLARACEDSLRRLRVDHLDLYQIHRPDLLAHPAEVAETLTRLREAGKIGEVGVSNHTAAQFAALQAYLPFPIAAAQIEFSPLAIGPLTDGVLDQAMTSGAAVLAWSPLAQGRLGDGEALGDPRSQVVRAALDAVAASNAVSRAVVAYAWILSHPSRPIPIVGSQQPNRIREAAQALDLSLDRAEWYAILTAARGAPLP